MNTEKDIFFTRRSVRKYIDRKIGDEEIKYILTAAMFAPSARNCRDWEFIVIDDREMFGEINKVHEYSNMILTASHAIIVCGDSKIDEKGYWIQNCSAATENILLAAEYIGIGSCWLGVSPVEKLVNDISQLFELPSHIVPFSIVTLGYPAVEPRIAKTRYEPNKIHFNKYGSSINF